MITLMLSRRDLLGGALLGGAAWQAAGGGILEARDKRPKMARVNVSKDRIIGITVGQRSFATQVGG
jgi:hypothetical protein